MVAVSVTPSTVRLALSRSEKLLGLLRDQEWPLEAITSVEVVEDGRAALRGLRAPGLALPGRRWIGTWRGASKTFVSVTAGRPALRIAVRGCRFDQALVDVDDPAGVVDELRRAGAAVHAEGPSSQD